MGKQRDRFEAWFKQWRGQRTPDEQDTLLKVAVAYDSAIERGELSPEELKLIVDAASHKRVLFWENTSALLESLAERFESAADAIRSMSLSRESHVRFVALCCVSERSPAWLLDDLLPRGLTDKSSRVRWKAAQQIGRFEKRAFLPKLEEALAQETNAKAKKEIEFQFLLLRDGHIVEPSTPSGFFVTVRHKGGILSGYITEEEIREKGVDRVAAKLREG